MVPRPAPKLEFREYYHLIDPDSFRENMKYDKDTGKLYRRYSPDGDWRIIKRREHRVTGYVFTFDKVKVLAQDAIWFIHHGEWPSNRLAAVDHDYYNLDINNFYVAGEMQFALGTKYIGYHNGIWIAEVRHMPYFKKRNTFKSKTGAEKWAEVELKKYNLYGYASDDDIQFKSDDKYVKQRGINYNKSLGGYAVRVKVGDEWKHYSYEKNIEDAVEAQAKGQKEIDEIWNDESLYEDSE